MALLEYRQRSGYLFLAVVLGHVLLISSRVNTRSGAPALETVTVGAVGEVQRAVSGLVGGISRAVGGYVALRGLREENESLKQRLAAADVQLQEQRALADRARGFADLLELKNRVTLRTTAAEIIGGAATPGFRTVTLDKGTSDGLQPDMAVMSPLGVVGRVVAPSRRSAKVQLLIDRNAAAGAIVERSRAQGVVIGTDENRLLMEYVSEVSDVVVGDAVVSSGVDGIYPKGLAIGTVESVEKKGPGFRRIVVKPAVDFTSLEQVLVVLDPVSPRDAAPRDTGGGVPE
jgi:rod shape-determining protein MreC